MTTEEKTEEAEGEAGQAGRRFRRLGRRRPRRRDDIEVDYKDYTALRKFISQQGKLHSRKRTGLSARRQRELKLAIKYARFLALLPYTGLPMGRA
jgi:small subunit ribosomal protein S18